MSIAGLFVIVSLILVLKVLKPSEEVTPAPDPIEEFSYSHYSDLRDAGKYDEAFDYADKYPDGDRYNSDLKYYLENQLSSLSLNNPTEYQAFIKKYQRLLNSLGINIHEFDQLQKPIMVDDNASSQQEHEHEQKPEARKAATEKATEKVEKAKEKAPVVVTITNEDKDNKTIGSAITTKASRSFSFEEGTYVNVTSKSDVKLMTNTPCSPISGGKRIKLESGKNYKFEIDNIIITINVKAKSDGLQPV